MQCFRIAVIGWFCTLLPALAVAQPVVYVGTVGARTHASLCPSASTCATPAVELYNATTGSRLTSRQFEAGGPTGFTGGDFALAPDGSRIYAMTSTGLMAVDVMTNELRILTHVATFGSIEVSPDGRELFVATGNQIKVVDTASLALTASIALPGSARDLTITPDGASLYVSYSDIARVSRVSTTTRTVDATFSVLTPRGLAVSVDGSRLYVVHVGTPSVTVVDTVTLLEVANVPLPVPTGSASRSGRGRIVVSATTAYISDLARPGIALLDLATNTVSDVIGGIADAGGVALSQDGRDLFVAYANGVMRLDTATRTLSHAMTTDTMGLTVAVLPPLPCLFEARVSPRAVSLAGGTLEITVPASPSCTWTASTAADWITATPLTGTGPSSISVTVPPAAGPRGGRLQVGAHEIAIWQTSPEVRVDIGTGQTLTQPTVVTGWAVDRAGSLASNEPFQGVYRPPSTGVDVIHVWAYPLPSGAPLLVGFASYGLGRDDVAAMYGTRYHPSGFAINVRGLPAGEYNLVFFAHSELTETFSAAALVHAIVLRAPVTLVVDAPSAGTVVKSPFAVAGWTIDRAAIDGPGIDAIHVWAYPASGAPPRFLGSAAYGGARPDVGAIFGAPYTSSGFNLLVALPPGSYRLAVFGHARETGLFDPATVVPITVAASEPRMYVDFPAANAAITGPFSVDGWALDLGAGEGSGVDAIHVWAYPLTGEDPVLLGAADPAPRPDVAAVFGSQYLMSGFHLAGATLAPGRYDLVVFARSSITGAFGTSFVVRIAVQEVMPAVPSSPLPR